MGWVHCGTLLIAQTSRLSPETFSGFRQKVSLEWCCTRNLHQEFAPGGTNLRAVKRCELPPRTQNVCITEHSLGCHLSPIANGLHIWYLKNDQNVDHFIWLIMNVRKGKYAQTDLRPVWWATLCSQISHSGQWPIWILDQRYPCLSVWTHRILGWICI